MRIYEVTGKTTAYNTGLAKVAVQCFARRFFVDLNIRASYEVCNAPRISNQGFS
jgi:hypothetical protein